MKLPAEFPGEEDVQRISSIAKGATATPLRKRWIDDPIHLNPVVEREEAPDVVALPATNEVLRRFNRDTERLATGILGVVVSAALVLAAPIQEGQTKAVDQATEERQTGGNALMNAGLGTLFKAVGVNAEDSTDEITSGQATGAGHPATPEVATEARATDGVSKHVFRLSYGRGRH